MARIQILELPMEHQGDDTTTPFVFVIDQVAKAEEEPLRRGTNTLDAFATQCGARGTLLFPGTLDIG
ncbi:hypothetical protein ACFVDH_13745 [Streptomyces sp. NPDC057674]|uniref:hypothetical protein n=1 Tax=Streptomyces sp. NPDC057674 TaxID=3346203 RepID=UPI0036C89C7B